MNRSILTSGGLVFAAILFLTVNIIANGTLTSWRLDVTENKLFTLSDGTKRILNKLEEPVTLRFYFSAKQFSGIPSLLNYGARIRDLLEEYAAASNGQITLIVTDPEPFSEAEDQAVGYGIQQLPLGGSGELAYFGLAGTNTTDDELTIPFFQPEKEQSLEYELTKLVYNLANPKDRVIGVITSLPIFGSQGVPPMGRGVSEPWTIVTSLREEFDLRDLGPNPDSIEKDVDTLLVIHPKDIQEPTLYAIDQFVLKGGKAMVFVDPLSESDAQGPNPQNPMVMPKRESDLPKLFEKWGISYAVDKVAGDLEASLRVNYSGGRGNQTVNYLPWMSLDPENLNSDDFITNELKSLNLGSVGILDKAEGSEITFTPLVSTGKQAMAMERDAILFIRDPSGLMDSFEPGDKELVLAARINGDATTAFPDGKPKKAEDDETDPDFVKGSVQPINVIVMADTDVLADRFWVRFQNFLGIKLASTHADNANFVLNALDNLGGNDDLISLRSRNQYARPFERVEAIQRDAEAQFRAQEQTLQAKLSETEDKLRELQKQNKDGGGLLLTPEQRSEIEKFRDEQVKTRKELRNVQHDMRKHIEGLGTLLKFINIGLIPILIGIFAIIMAFYRMNRRVPHAA